MWTGADGPGFMVSPVMQPSTMPGGGRYSLQMNRAAFTLVEMLVVVAIIAVLAGMLIPTVGMVRRMMSEVKCGNQLQQIGAAIEVYKNDNDDRFPEKLNDPRPQSSSDLFHAGGPLSGLKKILLCPFDGQKGMDVRMGRPPGYDNWSANADRSLQERKEPDSSYLYETSREFLIQDHIDFFFKDLPTRPTNQRPSLGSPEATWAAGKTHQRRFGNLLDDGVNPGAPFAGGVFPIVRCFHHYKWKNRESDAKNKKVYNVSWDLNVFKSTPFWETDANPLIPLPPLQPDLR